MASRARTVSGSTEAEQTGFIDSVGQRVRYRVRGNGPPLLMIHGIGAPLELWRPLESRLSDFQTITVDPPGAGHSSMPQGRFRMAQFAEVMDDLLTHLRLDSASVVGLSLGGMIAQEFAHRSPDRVDKLILASTSCGWSINPMTMSLFATPVRRYARDRGAPVAAAAAATLQAEPVSSLLRLHWELREHYNPSLRGYLVGLTAAWTWSSRRWLRELEMPVLAIAGSDDAIVPVANSRIIANSVRNGRLEVFPGAGHLCLLKQPVKAARLIREFLAQ